MGGPTHEGDSDPNLCIVADQVSCNEVEDGHDTHLTIDGLRVIKADHGKDYGHEGRHTR